VGLEVPKDELEQRIAARTDEMFRRGVETEVRAALARPVSSTAVQAIGLRAVAGLPRDEAVQAMNAQMRRYAAYQRKWMRRVPGLVAVRGDRPPEEVADEIVALAGARERVPARRSA
jgi:tRNA dimethylallyltransferase